MNFLTLAVQIILNQLNYIQYIIMLEPTAMPEIAMAYLVRKLERTVKQECYDPSNNRKLLKDTSNLNKLKRNSSHEKTDNVGILFFFYQNLDEACIASPHQTRILKYVKDLMLSKNFSIVALLILTAKQWFGGPHLLFDYFFGFPDNLII